MSKLWEKLALSLAVGAALSSFLRTLNDDLSVGRAAFLADSWDPHRCHQEITAVIAHRSSSTIHELRFEYHSLYTMHIRLYCRLTSNEPRRHLWPRVLIRLRARASPFKLEIDWLGNWSTDQCFCIVCQFYLSFWCIESAIWITFVHLVAYEVMSSGSLDQGRRWLAGVNSLSQFMVPHFELVCSLDVSAQRC